MRDSGALASAGADFVARFGCPDVVIANAGISRGFATELPEDLPVMRAIFETNVYGIVHTFQPFVAAMCELLALRGHERVLDVGTGSGYAAAVLSELAAEVVSIERIPSLAERARATLADAGYARVELRIGDGSLGVPDRAPFDAIAVAAAAPGVPPALRAQLGPHGRIVVPRGTRWSQRLVVLTVSGVGLVERRSLACRFVPLVGAGGFDDVDERLS